MKDVKKRILTSHLLIIILIMLFSIGLSYAFFAAQITGNETNVTLNLKGGTMDITYAGGQSITASNIYPRSAAWADKTITVTGNSTTEIDMDYSLTLKILTNTFSSNALKWTLSGTNTGNNGTIIANKSNQNISTGARDILLGTASFSSPTGGNKVHTYSLKILFPDTGGNQNADQGKSFTARVEIAAA